MYFCIIYYKKQHLYKKGNLFLKEKMVTTKDFKNIADILRRDVLKMTTKAGSGHPTSCLSCAEIMSVLFFNEMSYNTKDAFDPDNDEFILSKGHAAPILYSTLYRAGCIHEDLMTLRRFDSRLEGHPLPSALDWIKVATGSLGQGLSVGVGMALAAKLQKRRFRTYVLLGDSECAEGSVYEAFELAAHYNLDNLCAIIDVNRLGQSGETMLGHKVNEYKKRFEGFGWNVFVVNGHDVNEIINALKKARREKKPTVIIAKTYKGKGVSFLENKEGWHGKALDEFKLDEALKQIPDSKMPKFIIKKPARSGFRFRKINQEIVLEYKIGSKVATREAYGDALVKLAKLNNGLIAIDAEVKNSTYAEKILESDPKKYIEAYIAEQNMAGMALGLSVKGFDVFASSFACFLSRCHDQIRMAALSNANITFVGSHAGISIGEDGPSQMGLEDIAMFRALPGSIVFYPSDAVSAAKITELCMNTKGIKYIRTTRPKTNVIYQNNEKFIAGDFKVVKNHGDDRLVIVGTGITLHEALKAHDELFKKGIRACVVDLFCIKPFNSADFANLVRKKGEKVVIVEDHYPEGGIGEMMCKEFKDFNFNIKCLAVEKMPHSGKSEILMNYYGIDSKAIIRAALEMLEE